MNQIMTIFPYRRQTGWAFDDETKGLQAEAFVAGVDTIIQKLAGRKKKVTIHFSAEPFPNTNLELEFIREENKGNWYFSRELRMAGWFCPALYKYFTKAPEKIYAQVL